MAGGPEPKRSEGGDRPGSRVPLIRVSSLMPVVEEMDRRGPRAEALIARHLLSRAQLSDPYLEIPLARYVAFLEEAAAVEGDPLLGARVGGQFRPAHLGPVGLLFGSSSTLRRGLERLARWLMAWQDGTVMRIEAEADRLVWTYRLDSGIGPRRQDSEYSVAATLALAREAFGAAGRPVAIEVEHDAPADPGPLSRLLGLRPAFNQPGNRLIFDLAEAERVQRNEDRDLMAVLERHVADLCQPVQGPEGLVGKVRTLVLMHLGHRPITLPMIAAELRTSPRTLVRACRLELGRVQLLAGRTSTAEIARTLGYADATAFWRAFKAETGTAPSRFRRPG